MDNWTTALRCVVLLLLFIGGVSAQEDSIPVVAPSTESSESLDLTLVGAERADSVEVLDADAKEKFNKRYQVGGAIAVMAFVGIIIGSASALNPK